MTTRRTVVFEALAADASLSGMGIVRENLYPSWSTDSPAADQMRWMVIKWGGEEPGPGRDTSAAPRELSIWMYNREKDFAVVDAALGRVLTVLSSLVPSTWSGGALIDVTLAFKSEDLYDPDYDAVMKYCSFRIVSSGL